MACGEVEWGCGGMYWFGRLCCDSSSFGDVDDPPPRSVARVAESLPKYP